MTRMDRAAKASGPRPRSQIDCVTVEKGCGERRLYVAAFTDFFVAFSEHCNRRIAEGNSDKPQSERLI